MSTKAYYLCGPMTGVAQSNKPLFEYAAKSLRERGWLITSPAELDSLEEIEGCFEQPYGSMYWHVLARDVELVGRLDGIVFLPNWEKSTGARIEASVGLLRAERDGFEFWSFRGALDPYRVSTFAVRNKAWPTL